MMMVPINNQPGDFRFATKVFGIVANWPLDVSVFANCPPNFLDRQQCAPPNVDLNQSFITNLIRQLHVISYERKISHIPIYICEEMKYKNYSKLYFKIYIDICVWS